MHFLNLLTIRMYVLVSVLFTNKIPEGLQHGLRVLDILRIPFNRNNWNSMNQSTIDSLYGGGDGKNASVVNFYINFSKYLKTTNPTMSIFRSLAGHIAHWFYEIANTLQTVYISMFSIFGDVTKDSTAAHFFKYTKYVGWAAFMVLLAIYGIGMIFNIKGGFSRMKDLIVGMLMGLGVLIILPTLTNGFVGGMQKTVTSILGNPNTGTAKNELTYQSPKNKSPISPADEIVRNNVVSIPNMTTYAGLNNVSTFNTNDNKHAFQATGKPFSNHIASQPYNINLYRMGNNPSSNQDIAHQRDVWNGIGQSDVGDFLSRLGSDGSYLDRNTVNDDANMIRKNLGKRDFYNTDQYRKIMILYHFYEIMNLPASLTADGIHHIMYHFEKNDNSENLSDFATQMYGPYMYQITGDGDTAQLSMLKQFSKDNTDLLAAFHTSYAKYQVNWVNIFTGLGSLIAILLGLIFKLTNSFFKMVVMYATSGWFLLKNSADHNKIKDFVRTFFGIFENLIMDLIILRLFLTTYFDISSVVQNMNISPLTIGLIQPFIAYGLFKVESKGIDTLSSQMSGQNTQSGNGLGAIGAAGAAWLGAKSIGSMGRTAAGMTARGGKKGIAAGAHTALGLTSGSQHNKATNHPGYQPGHVMGGLRGKLAKATGNTQNTSSRTNGKNGTSSESSGSGDSNNQSQNSEPKGKNQPSLKQKQQGQNGQGNNGTENGGPTPAPTDGQNTNLNGNESRPYQPNNDTATRVGRIAGFFGRQAISNMVHSKPFTALRHSHLNPGNYSWSHGDHRPKFNKQKANATKKHDLGAYHMKQQKQNQKDDGNNKSDDKKKAGDDNPK